MLEKIAYWIVLIQMPIYISQKGVPGGLNWEQTTKGIIFFLWAAVQNFTPIFWGYLSDKYSYKKVMLVALSTNFIGYILLIFMKEPISFTLSVIILGIGSAIFKPTLQGNLSRALNDKNSAKGWGIYFMLLNLSVFIAPPISKLLKDINWEYVFLFASIITLLNMILNLILSYQDYNKDISSLYKINLKNVFIHLIRKDNLIFILSMSGFAIIYMQFYEILPNFLYDWANTSSLAKYLPNFILMESGFGKVISYEWLYNINAGLVIIFVTYISIKTSKMKILNALILGNSLATIGLFISGFSYIGIITILGMIIYTFGEMITNPKFTDYLSNKADYSNKSMYLSFLNISFGIGLSFGSLLGSWLYKNFGEKAMLAKNYLAEKYNLDYPLNQSYDKLVMLTGLNDTQLTELLFNQNYIYLVWLPFLIIGIISIIGLFYLKRK